MKYSVLVILALIIAGVMVAGCTQGPAAPVATATPTEVPTPWRQRLQPNPRLRWVIIT